MPDRFAATEMTYTGMSSDSSYGLLMSSPSSALPCPAEQFGARVLARRGDPEVLERGAGLAVQVLRHGDLDRDEQRAQGSVLAADTAAWNAEHLAVRSTRRNPQGHGRPPVSGHLDLRPQGQLGDRDRHGYREVVPGAAEHRVRFHVNPHVQVSGPAAVLARCALARDPDPLAVRDARRDPRLDGPRAHRPPAAGARGAGVVDHQAAAAAGGARLGEPEAAEVAALLSGAAAVRADLRHRAGLGAGAVADRAGSLPGQPQRHGRAVDGVAERQRGLRLHVRAAPRPALGGSATAEDPAEHVTEPLAAEEVAEVEGRTEAAAAS